MARKPQTLSEAQRGEVESVVRSKVLSWFLTALALLGGIAGLSLWQIKSKVEQKMEALVTQQFEEPRIRDVVKQAASEKASHIMVAQITPEVSKFKADVADQLQEVRAVAEKTRELEMESQAHRDAIAGVLADLTNVDARISSASRRLGTVESNLATATCSLDDLNKQLDLFGTKFEALTEEQHFLTLANRARLYSLPAFLELERVSQTTNTFAKDAGQIVWALRRDMEIDRQSLTQYIPIEVNNETNEYRGPFTSEELAFRLRLPHAVEGAANVVRTSDLKCFMPELVQLAQREKNLWVENRITYAISSLSGKTFYPWTLGSLSNWWATSSSSFTNWPYAQYEKAMEHLFSSRYGEAATAFEMVAKSDPYADMSRCLGIACALEVGDTNTAFSLGTSWKYPDGRWARWAKAKTALTTGDVADATAQFASIAAEFPTFSEGPWLNRGNPLLRKLDWPLFDQKRGQASNKGK